MFAAMTVMAGNVDMTTAQTKAANFLLNKASHGRLMTSAPAVKWVHEVKNSSKATQAAFYIVNTDRGYVIVAGDDRAREILAYGEGTLTDLNDLPEAVQYFLDIYQKQMEYLQAHPGMMPQKFYKNRGVSVEPLLTTSWSQGKPYNMKTPKVGYGSDPYCKVGCSAVALAQVMRYWEYPEVSPALPGYTTATNHYVMDPLPEYTFDWDNMLDYYKSSTDQYTDAQLDAISWFMRYVGQAETMDYSTDQSGAEREEIMQALGIFGYIDARVIEKWDFNDGTVNYTDEGWGELIQSELIAGRPLIYCAFDMSSDSTGISGHAFNVDGYDAANDMYHVNFGMSPEKNTYYALNAFTIDGGMTTYDFFPILFADVQKPGMTTNPSIYPSTQSLNMECYTGETTTATFDVSSANLTDDITLTLNDTNNVFSIDVNTIAVAEAMNKTVTVAYAPQAVGNHTATITLSSEGAYDKVITLNGTATNKPLVKYDPVMLAADSTYITKTSFRAEWTDQTVPENVVSYTLEVNQKPNYTVLAEADWTETIEVFPNQASDWANSGLIPEGWDFTGNGLWAEDRFMSFKDASISIPEFTGFDKVTVVFTGKGAYGSANITVATSQASQSYTMARNDVQQYVVVLDCAETDKVTFTAVSGYAGLLKVAVYSGEVTPPTALRATEQGNETKRTITGITDKYYTVKNLLAEGTFLYKVKALYTDGTESAWSNTQMVTLFDNGSAAHNYELGDVNHDHLVNIADVTALIDYLLGSGNACLTCADVNNDNAVNIADVTALIDKLLSGN